MEKPTHKSIVTAFLLLTALLFPASSAAQSSRAIGEAFANTVRKYSATEADSLAKVLVRKYGRQPEVLTQLGRAYFRNRELDKAKKMLDLATERNPKAAAPLIQYGDMYKYYWNMPNSLDTAWLYYRKAVAAEPVNNVPYERMADLCMFKYRLYGNRQTHGDSLLMRQVADSAITVLLDLKRVRPDFPAELTLGGIYNRLGRFRESAEAYSKVKGLLEDYQYNNYALGHYFLGEYATGLGIAKEGQAKYPDFPLFHRTMMYCLFGMNRYDEALGSYARLLQSTDSLVSFDYFHAGRMYLSKGDIRTATETFDRIYDTHGEFANGHLQARRTLIADYIDSVKADGGYLRAAGEYAAHIAVKRNRHGYDYYHMADIYREMIDDTLTTEADRRMATVRADSIYAVMQREFPDYEPTLMHYLRARMNAAVDKDAAVPHYLRLLECVDAPPESEDPEAMARRRKAFLTDACRFLAVYFLHGDDLNSAAKYAFRYKEANPSDRSLDPIIKLYNESRGGKKRRR
ncbi:MAG: hypothetical protein NC344_02980 [Bacteroidales bacterium]|nr:hypothetical protein [Bacteroidales bacterium]MCM1146796.1 hypothetical protein [Bacteroidales bacterium]MCM1205707.1 hypothetical protein [Bacillota bacterium]MCM1510763.1 hypothetical protein [Clostridium sp.]